MLVVMLVACGAFVSADRAVGALEAEGWTEVRINGKNIVAPAFSGCGDQDDVAFKATGKNPAGRDSTATVCCGGLFKGCTIRH